MKRAPIPAHSPGKSANSEVTDQGTIFLDEIGELHCPFKPSSSSYRRQLFERIGGLETIRVNARVIAATNQRSSGLVAKKEFREDLFFRLSVIPIQIPPLRERLSDVRLLAHSSWINSSKELHRQGLELSPEAARSLEEYSWPGNVT